ncbi:MAG TPA: 5-(carboxyamino)imidazole ribonucleotide synthase [Thermomicrobiales bacterium]|nr:5-(carboxyamino)imidazole ribonucleotide synthase [Thermomicrobiales bacterium]
MVPDPAAVTTTQQGQDTSMTTSRTVGIVGAGQLARMMAQAAIPLDIHLVLLAADPEDGAAMVVPDVLVGSPDDPEALRRLAERCDVLTFDHELVDPETLAALEADGHVVWPSSATMALAQNKRRQRAELHAAGMPVPAFRHVERVEDVIDFAAGQQWPVVLKASRGGYDGRGVWVVRDEAEAREVVADAHANGLVLLAEQYLDLQRELAVLVARRANGELAVWEPVETVQQDGICVELCVPVEAETRLIAEAASIARAIAERIEAVGVLAIEFFIAGDTLYVNELAPRPHNSGHWTIEGAATSQFEQHLRAVLDLPLGETAMRAPVVATTNLLGPADGSDPLARLPQAVAVRGAHVHLYGKGARAGRKLGHVTTLGKERDETRQRAAIAVALLRGEGGMEDA